MSNEYNFEDGVLVSSLKASKKKSNRAERGISISKAGLLKFKSILANQLGLQGDKDYSLTFSLIKGKILAIRLTEGSSGDVSNKGNTKRTDFSIKGLLTKVIEEEGTEEVKGRWLKMFGQRERYDEVELEFNSFTFTDEYVEKYTEIKEEANGLTRKGNDFFIDLMSGKGNKQDGTKKQKKKE